MNIYRVTIAEVKAYTSIGSEQQCHHDIALDDLVEIGPVNRSTIGSSASITLIYNRAYNNSRSIHFPFYGEANTARDALVEAWKEHQAPANSQNVLNITAPNGLTSINLTGLRAATPTSTGVALIFGSPKDTVELTVAKGVDRDTLLQEISTHLKRKIK